jgi:hypothetical protein
MIATSVPEKPVGHGHGGVAGVAPGGERIGLLGADQVEPRHRDLGAMRKVGRHLLEFGDLPRRERAGAACRQRELVGEPVAGDVHEDGQRDEDVQRAAADGTADGDQQCGEGCDQQPGTYLSSEPSRCDTHGLESPFD